MNQMTTGASNDFERASQLARDMVMRYGMSDKMGVMVYAENEGEVFLGRSVTKTTHISEKTMQQVDAEIRRILDEQYKRARDLIEGHQKEMHRMAKALLDWETIDGDQIDDILAGNEPRPPISGEDPELYYLYWSYWTSDRLHDPNRIQWCFWSFRIFRRNIHHHYRWRCA